MLAASICIKELDNIEASKEIDIRVFEEYANFVSTLYPSSVNQQNRFHMSILNQDETAFFNFLPYAKEALIELFSVMKEHEAHKDAALAASEKTIAEFRRHINQLTEALKLAKLRHYSAKSEKYSPDQLSIFDEPEPPENVEEIESAEAQIQIPA